MEETQRGVKSMDEREREANERSKRRRWKNERERGRGTVKKERRGGARPGSSSRVHSLPLSVCSTNFKVNGPLSSFSVLCIEGGHASEGFTWLAGHHPSIPRVCRLNVMRHRCEQTTTTSATSSSNPHPSRTMRPAGFNNDGATLSLAFFPPS